MYKVLDVTNFLTIRKLGECHTLPEAFKLAGKEMEEGLVNQIEIKDTEEEDGGMRNIVIDARHSFADLIS